MLKLGGTEKNGRRFVLIGLSYMNLDRLRNGKPIHIFGEEIGINVDVMIMTGETEESMMAELRASGLEVPPATRIQKQ